jgi:hypothetical protein
MTTNHNLLRYCHTGNFKTHNDVLKEASKNPLNVNKRFSTVGTSISVTSEK